MPPKKKNQSCKKDDKLDKKKKSVSKSPSKEIEEEEKKEIKTKKEKKATSKSPSKKEEAKIAKEKGKKKLKTDEGEQPANIKIQSIENFSLGDGKFQNSKITISSWNINGLRAVSKENNLLEYIKSAQPDVICLNELKTDEINFNSEDLSKLLPNDYNWYMNFCKPPNKGYAGCAILSKVKPISVKLDLGIKKHDQEGRTVTLEFEKFFLVACYVPNAGEKLVRLKYRTKEWDPDFLNYLDNLKKQKHVILCGDLNCAHEEIDISNPKGNLKTAGFTVEERAEFTKLLNSGYIDTFRKLHPKEVKYSFWSYRSGARKTNKGWRLDYFICNDSMFPAIEESKIVNEIMGSDHCPLELDLNLLKL